jgi:hypothetical protein
VVDAALCEWPYRHARINSQRQGVQHTVHERNDHQGWNLSLEGGDGSAHAVLWDLREGGMREEKRREGVVNDLRSGRSLKFLRPTATTIPSCP